MNHLDHMKLELTAKCLEANARNTQYNFHLYMDDNSFGLFVYATHTPSHTQAKYEIAKYASLMKDDPLAEEKALNFAIAELNYFNRDSQLHPHVRVDMYAQMLDKCMEKDKPTGWITDYFNLEGEVNHETA